MSRAIQPMTETARAAAETVLAAVCDAHGFTPDEIRARSRHANIVKIRAEAAYRIWRSTDLPYREIGQVLGGIDHSSVIYLVRKHELRHGS